MSIYLIYSFSIALLKFSQMYANTPESILFINVMLQPLIKLPIIVGIETDS